jgi:hypothetical protein
MSDARNNRTIAVQAICFTDGSFFRQCDSDAASIPVVPSWRGLNKGQTKSAVLGLARISIPSTEVN